jgi:ribonuclease HI
MREIAIYTDGGKHPDVTWGAWAWIVIAPTGLIIKNDSGYLEGSTNNGCEIYAAFQGLRAIARREISIGRCNSIHVYTDSIVIRDAIGLSLIDQWAQNHWKKCDRYTLLSEYQLWVQVYDQILKLRDRGLNVNCSYVPGHSGVYWNEQADRMVKARQSARRYQTA